MKINIQEFAEAYKVHGCSGIVSCVHCPFSTFNNSTECNEMTDHLKSSSPQTISLALIEKHSIREKLKLI